MQTHESPRFKEKKEGPCQKKKSRHNLRQEKIRKKSDDTYLGIAFHKKRRLPNNLENSCEKKKKRGENRGPRLPGKEEEFFKKKKKSHAFGGVDSKRGRRSGGEGGQLLTLEWTPDREKKG